MKHFFLYLTFCLSYFLSEAAVITFRPQFHYFDRSQPALWIDVNRDGIDDFLYESINGSMFRIFMWSPDRKLLCDGANNLIGVLDSTVISSEISPILWADTALVRRNHGGPYSYPVNTYANFAFQFLDGDGIHYGYVSGYLTWMEGSYGFVDYVLTQIGYETTPNYPIKVAATTSMVGLQDSKVPELSIIQRLGSLELSFERHMAGFVELCDIQGRTMLRQEMNGRELRLDVSSLSSGLYVLNIGYQTAAGKAYIRKKLIL